MIKYTTIFLLLTFFPTVTHSQPSPLYHPPSTPLQTIHLRENQPAPYEGLLLSPETLIFLQTEIMIQMPERAQALIDLSIQQERNNCNLQIQTITNARQIETSISDQQAQSSQQALTTITDNHSRAIKAHRRRFILFSVLAIPLSIAIGYGASQAINR